MKDRNELRLQPLKFRSEHLSEQVVVPVPLALVVQGHDEEVRVLERLQPARGVGSFEKLVAESAAHSIEHGCPGEELDVAAFQAGEVLGAQIIRDEAVLAREGRNGIRASRLLQIERREVKTGGPSLCLTVELFGLGLRNGDARRRQ